MRGEQLHRAEQPTRRQGAADGGQHGHGALTLDQHQIAAAQLAHRAAPLGRVDQRVALQPWHRPNRFDPVRHGQEIDARAQHLQLGVKGRLGQRLEGKRDWIGKARGQRRHIPFGPLNHQPRDAGPAFPGQHGTDPFGPLATVQRQAALAHLAAPFEHQAQRPARHLAEGQPPGDGMAEADVEKRVQHTGRGDLRLQQDRALAHQLRRACAAQQRAGAPPGRRVRPAGRDGPHAGAGNGDPAHGSGPPECRHGPKYGPLRRSPRRAGKKDRLPCHGASPGASLCALLQVKSHSLAVR